MSLPRVLVIAGSDSGGGAGVQADVKTITALGGYAATAITALTAQNTLGVFDVLPVPADFVGQQIAVVLSDIGCDAVKLGMLHSAPIVERVAAELSARALGIPVVVDPVMLAKGGAPLLDPKAVKALTELLIPRAALLTPNAPEAGILAQVVVDDESGMLRAAERLLQMGASAVLVKGGHLPGERVVDLLCTADGEQHRFESERLLTTSTHGTGCTLASAAATGIAEGLRLFDAVARARQYVHEAIRRAPGFGSGHGPLDHTHPCGAK